MTQHSSRLCKGYLTKDDDGMLHQMTWPPQSPDLNTIEMVWEELERRVKEKKPTSAQHMWELLQDCWKSIPGEHERVSRLDSSGAYDREAYDARRENRMAARKKAEEEAGCTDYKKMYEEAMSTNERLKSRLQGSKQELVLVQTQLEKVTQRKITMTERSNERSMLEKEKRETRVLQKKISDMEDEVKIQTELQNENQRLKDENGALIRVISKLSK
uniref:cGMP-dependent protein kinase interacting domain-containing protein n=1 Tax=Oncorhynchus tshawytscha TaxID=74940 RepID=A0AAZ3SV69_ONCTS